MKALNNMLTYVSCLLFSVSTALYILFFFTLMVFAFITPSSPGENREAVFGRVEHRVMRFTGHIASRFWIFLALDTLSEL